MISTILVPLDLSASCAVALEVGASLARRLGASVELVTVASPGCDHLADRMELRELASQLDAPDVRTRVVESNHVAGALIDAAGSDGLICLETRAHGPLGAIVLGSVADDVLRRTTRPVLLVGPSTKPVAPFDLLEACIDGPDVIAAVVPVVGELSNALHAQVRLAHVRVPDHPRFPSEAEAAACLDDAVRRLEDDYGVAAEQTILRGHMAPVALLDDAEDHGASIVAVGVRPLSALRRRILGSFAIAVAHATTAAVLAIPSQGEVVNS